MAAFLRYIHRLVSIPMDRFDFEIEVKTLEHLANVNHLNINLRPMIHRKIMKNLLDLTTSIPRSLTRKRGEKWVRLPFLGKFSREIGRVLRPFDFKPVCYNLCSLKHFLPPFKDSIHNDEKSGIYSLKCNDCPGICKR